MPAEGDLDPLHRAEQVHYQGEDGSLRSLEKQRRTALTYHPLDDLGHFQHRIDFGLNAAKQARPLQMVGVAAQIGEVPGTGGHGGEG